MEYDLSQYRLVSPENEINEFVENNEYTLEILKSIHPLLIEHFSDGGFSLEISDKLEWTTEEKLLVNVPVSKQTFFNDVLGHFNDIYEKIGHLLEDIFCPIVLFPDLSNESYDRMGSDSTINLIAKNTYFNSDFDKNLQREMSLRDIPKSQMKKEILEYCQDNPNPDLSDIIFDLQLDLFDVDSIIDEIESEGIDLNVKW